METTMNIDIASTLRLTQRDGDLFFDRSGGFPVGCKIIDALAAPLLLFQVRHPFAADAPEVKAVKFDAEISQLETGKQLEVEYENKVAWLTFPNGGELLANN